MFPIEGVNARGVWADPANLTICNCPGAPVVCYDWDTDCYNFPPGLLSALYDLILEKEVGIARSTEKQYDDNEVSKTPV